MPQIGETTEGSIESKTFLERPFRSYPITRIVVWLDQYPTPQYLLDSRGQTPSSGLCLYLRPVLLLFRLPIGKWTCITLRRHLPLLSVLSMSESLFFFILSALFDSSWGVNNCLYLVIPFRFLQLSCRHRCPLTCHSGPCVPETDCNVNAHVYCSCKRIKKTVPCHALSKQSVIACDDVCRRKKDQEIKVYTRECRLVVM